MNVFFCIVKSALKKKKIMRGGEFDKRGGKSRMRVSDGPTDHYPKTVSSVMVSGTSEYQGTVKFMRALLFLFRIGVIPLNNRKTHENDKFWDLII